MKLTKSEKGSVPSDPNRLIVGKLAALIVTALLASCGDGIPDGNGYGTDGSTAGNYFSVVGYYNDGKKEYRNLGVFKLGQCRSWAIAEYNAINARRENRAFDWFCKNTHSGRIDR
jgi:hypothetical protein